MTWLIRSILTHSMLLYPVGRVSGVAPPVDALLIEIGDYLLLETGDKLLLE